EAGHRQQEVQQAADERPIRRERPEDGAADQCDGAARGLPHPRAQPPRERVRERDLRDIEPDEPQQEADDGDRQADQRERRHQGDDRNGDERDQPEARGGGGLAESVQRNALERRNEPEQQEARHERRAETQRLAPQKLADASYRAGLAPPAARIVDLGANAAVDDGTWCDLERALVFDMSDDVAADPRLRQDAYRLGVSVDVAADVTADVEPAGEPIKVAAYRGADRCFADEKNRIAVDRSGLAGRQASREAEQVPADLRSADGDGLAEAENVGSDRPEYLDVARAGDEVPLHVAADHDSAAERDQVAGYRAVDLDG